ncbi:hypothetical protein [Streptomyces sp. NPDC048411]
MDFRDGRRGPLERETSGGADRRCDHRLKTVDPAFYAEVGVFFG